jgi:CRISPR-associated protein Csb1
MNLTPLANESRLLVEARFKPIQGTRFQPTGFPDLGPATYTLPDGTPMLLVESAQSMANHLERLCWDDANDRLVPELTGMPYVEAALPDGAKTNSLLEAHRLNSPYIVRSAGFRQIAEAIDFKKSAPFHREKLVKAIFTYDPTSIIHGVFLEKIAGIVRLPRALTAFIEARNVVTASYGGAKLDRVQPATGDDTPYGKADEGFGNVIYHKDDFAIPEHSNDSFIKCYFNVDLDLVRGFPLSDDQKSFLIWLCLFKIAKFLCNEFRPRSGCDLKVVEVKVQRPAQFVVPDIKDVSSELTSLSKRLFNDPKLSPLKVTFDRAIKEPKDRAYKS